MPATRRSPRRKAKADEAEHQEEEEEEKSDDDSEGEEQESSSRNNDARDSASKRSTSRELRKRRRDELKTKSMGVGLSISKNATNSNKIVFDDNEVFDGDDTAGEDVSEQVQENESDNDSDDDAIEEVKSSVARDKAMDQLARERETAVEQKLQTKTKKRKAKATPTIEEEEEDFDENFFAQVDSEMAEQRKQRKLDKLSVPTGRHTTFLSTEEEADSRPIQAEHNIELVVLGNDTEGPTSATNTLLDSTSDKAGIEPSEASHLFARDRLTSGKANKKGTKKKKQTDPGWRRSKKMNVLAFGRTKAKRSNGRAAANFVVN
jgi:hypothetical protein